MHAAIFGELANHQYQRTFGRGDGGRKGRSPARQCQALISTAWEAEVGCAVSVAGVAAATPLDADAVVVGCAL
jgi:hypothetical protein